MKRRSKAKRVNNGLEGVYTLGCIYCGTHLWCFWTLLKVWWESRPVLWTFVSNHVLPVSITWWELIKMLQWTVSLLQILLLVFNFLLRFKVAIKLQVSIYANITSIVAGVASKVFTYNNKLVTFLIDLKSRSNTLKDKEARTWGSGKFIYSTTRDWHADMIEKVQILSHKPEKGSRLFLMHLQIWYEVLLYNE